MTVKAIMKKYLLVLLAFAIPLTAFCDPVTSQFQPNGIMIWSTSGTKVSLQDLRAFANVAASQTDSVIVAAVAGKKIRVLAWGAVAGATATNLTFNSKPAGAGVAISQLFANGANGGEVYNFNPLGWFETVAGEGLTVTTGAGATTGINVSYITY